MFGNIDFLQSAYTICFGIAIAAAVLAASLFFLLDIREIFLFETGRAQRKTVGEIHNRNQKTGKLRDNTMVDLRTAEEAAVKSTASAKTEYAGGFGGYETQRSSPGISFRITQKTIVIHTDEKIPL